jgi:hypothetical protein
MRRISVVLHGTLGFYLRDALPKMALLMLQLAFMSTEVNLMGGGFHYLFLVVSTAFL